MIQRITIAILFVICLCATAKLEAGKSTTDPAVLKDWKLVFKDEFSRRRVDASQWGLYDGPGHDHHGLRSPSAFSVSHGHLVITAQMENGVLVSGGMCHRTDYTYGRFEFRVRTEEDPSGAASGVVLTWPKSERWPQDGENDMYETGTIPTDRSSFNTFIHYSELQVGKACQFKHAADATAWHIVAMEWEPKELRIYRDGELVWTLTDVKAIPHVPHHLCLQLDAFKETMGARSACMWIG